MSKQQWAAIVYGRSYHLDFRFITIPHDFTKQNVTWASQHILATTHQARKLDSYPRWSLFKNDVYCVAGVTCMVRDLIGQLNQNSIKVKTKDNQGRPLYVFVGYATSLNQEQTLSDFPAYTGSNLATFEPLYQQIERVWFVKDYEPNSKYPLLSQYQFLNSSVNLATPDHSINYVSQLNHQARYPDRMFLWSSSPAQNKQLWTASTQCSEPTSLCLNINDKFLPNSPFLNQSVSQLKQFTIKERIVPASRANSMSKSSIYQQKSPENPNSSANFSLPQKISTRAKEDLDLTLQQAAKVTAASQEFINNFTDWSNPNKAQGKYSDSQDNQDENFGFKTKESPKSSSNSQSQEQDWF